MRPAHAGLAVTRLFAVALCALLAAPALAEGAALGRAGEIPRLKARQKDGAALDLPLQHTAVEGQVAGYVARVTVTQIYGNPFEDPIEAVYVFPLPDNAAVDDFRMVIGQRVIEADIRKREEARRTYEAARRAGNTAALLEQERPNIFTQSIANIAPGEEIRVVTRFVQTLTYDEGSYELVFPLVVGPRYMPGEATGGPPSGTGAGLGYDGLGTVGSGAAAGSGSAVVLQGRSRSVSPAAQMSEAVVVAGSLDKTLIERVIRSHLAQMRYCYERELRANPTLAGRVVLRITIGPDGKVIDARIGGGTLRSPAVERCLLERVERWVFPAKPGGGVVQVSYPLVFTNGRR